MPSRAPVVLLSLVMGIILHGFAQELMSSTPYILRGIGGWAVFFRVLHGILHFSLFETLDPPFHILLVYALAFVPASLAYNLYVLRHGGELFFVNWVRKQLG